MVLNSGQLLHPEVLNNHLGLAISPTLIGSLVVMGGALILSPLGAILVGMIIKWFDWLYEWAKPSRTAIRRPFCRGSALRRGVQHDRVGAGRWIHLVSRVVFFLHYFRRRLVLAKLLYWLFDTARLIKARVTRTRALASPPQVHRSL